MRVMLKVRLLLYSLSHCLAEDFRYDWNYLLLMNFLFQAKRCWRRPQVSLTNVLAVTSTTKLVLQAENNLACFTENKHFCPFLLSEVVCGLGRKLSFLIDNLLKSWGTG